MNTMTKSKTLGRSIMEHYKAYKVLIVLQILTSSKYSVLYRVHIEPGTTINALMAHAKEVKTILKIPYFILAQYEQTIFLSVSSTNNKFVTLDDMLHAKGIEKVTDNLMYPVALGKDIFGNLVYEDLADLMHTAYTGSTGSGKSVGLQCLIMSLASFRSPEEVNFVIIDAGGGSLWCFEGLPHLSCPVIKDIDEGLYALHRLVAEMERRLKLSKEELDKLPAIVCVFDEFVSFLGAPGKKYPKACAKLINSIIRRARKVRIYLVLATQSPKQEYLKDVDVNNLTTRVAFGNKSKANQSSALGVSGAENLMGKGDLLLDTQQYSEPLRLQGAYISESEIKQRVAQLAKESYDTPNKFVISLSENLKKEVKSIVSDICGGEDRCQNNGFGPDDDDDDEDEDDYTENLDTYRFILWTLDSVEISVSKIHQKFGFSRKVAERYVKMMDEHGFLAAKNSNQPRKVIPQDKSDLNEEQLEFLSEFGINEEILTELYNTRNS